MCECECECEGEGEKLEVRRERGKDRERRSLLLYPLYCVPSEAGEVRGGID